MFLLIGISGKTKPAGLLRGCVCPACGRREDLRVIRKYLTPTLFFIPTFPFGSSYLATCPGCASVMELRREAAHALRRDPDYAAGEGDLTLVQNNSAGRCPACGARNGAGANYCSGCGGAMG